MLSGGLGPTGISRYDRDILSQQGVRWVIVFEGVNDIGGVSSAAAATTTANNLIAAYKQMILQAHTKNIRIYGGTIMPFNGNSYYNQYSELCRNTVNQWIRTKGNYDACIDFAMVMRNPQDTTRLLLPAYQNDGLHPDSAGYKVMGNAIDLNLFTGADTIFQKPTGVESFWFEAERFVTATVGTNFNIVSDVLASNGKYITVKPGTQSLSAPPTDSSGLITIPYTVSKDTTYNIFARMKNPTADDDSYWVQVDKGAFTLCNGLVTGNSFVWLKLVSSVLTKGGHTLTIGYREDGACLDKLCITNTDVAPLGMGEADPGTLGVNSKNTIDEYLLGQNYPNPFNPTTTIEYSLPTVSNVNLKIYDLLGREVATLVHGTKEAGSYKVQFDASYLSSGVYFYRIVAGSFTSVKNLVLMK